VNRGLVAVGYELHESRGKTKNSRRYIDLDPTTTGVLQAWHALLSAEATAIGNDQPGGMFTTPDDHPIHPHALSQAFERIARRSGVKVIRLHDLRHTHATLLIAAGVPIKLVSERLGHASAAFTIETYQHVLPGMQAEAARTIDVMPEGLLLVTSPALGPSHRHAGRGALAVVKRDPSPPWAASSAS
jgi:integrase